MPPVKITVLNNGSLRVEGEFELYDHEGNRFDLGGRTALSFCRCGLSQNKPLCDSSHRLKGWTSEVRARSLPPAAPK